MKNLKNSLLFIILFICFISCAKEEICTTCTEAQTGVTSDYCETENLVEFFENELIEQGADLGQSWTCVRK